MDFIGSNPEFENTDNTYYEVPGSFSRTYSKPVSTVNVMLGVGIKLGRTE